jgi:hypothetical protein
MSRSHFAKFLLFAAMAVCLPITMAGEAVALVYDGKLFGNEAGTAADVFGWLFAVAFAAIFLLAIYEQDRKLARRSVRRETSH